MIVVDLEISGGLPVIQSASLIKKESESGWTSVHFARFQSIMLFSVGAGKFLAIENRPGLLRRLPNGMPWRAFIRSAARRGWRYWLVDGTDADGDVVSRRVRVTEDVPGAAASAGSPWNIGGVVVTRARPTLPSVCGQPENFLRDHIEVED